MAEFAKWISYFPKHENAPDFVIATFSINANTISELAAQVEEHKNEKWYCNFQILRQKNDTSKYSVTLNDYKKEEVQDDAPEFKTGSYGKVKQEEEISIESIPF